MQKNEAGLYVPNQALPAGYARFKDSDGDPMAIAVAFIVAVDARFTEEGAEQCHVWTTTSEEPFAVEGTFDEVVQTIREAQ